VQRRRHIYYATATIASNLAAATATRTQLQRLTRDVRGADHDPLADRDPQDI